MPTGTVRSFSRERGFGSIAPDGGSNDVFVGVSALENADLSTLKNGDKVQFALILGKNGKFVADNLKAIEPRRNQA